MSFLKAIRPFLGGVKICNTSTRLILRGVHTTSVCCSCSDDKTDTKTDKTEKGKLRKAKTPVGRLDVQSEESADVEKTAAPGDDVYKAFPGGKNPATGEIGGPKGPEPTRYGDWERKGRVIDF
jgi:hypothetical protein